MDLFPKLAGSVAAVVGDEVRPPVAIRDLPTGLELVRRPPTDGLLRANRNVPPLISVGEQM